MKTEKPPIKDILGRRRFKFNSMGKQTENCTTKLFPKVSLPAVDGVTGILEGWKKGGGS